MHQQGRPSRHRRHAEINGDRPAKGRAASEGTVTDVKLALLDAGPDRCAPPQQESVPVQAEDTGARGSRGRAASRGLRRPPCRTAPPPEPGIERFIRYVGAWWDRAFNWRLCSPRTTRSTADHVGPEGYIIKEPLPPAEGGRDAIEVVELTGPGTSTPHSRLTMMNSTDAGMKHPGTAATTSRSVLRTVAVFALALVIAGCAASKAFDSGTEAARANEWDLAVQRSQGAAARARERAIQVALTRAMVSASTLRGARGGSPRAPYSSTSR